MKHENNIHRKKKFKYFLSLGIVLAIFLAFASAFNQDPTYDEKWHLLWSKKLYENKTTSREKISNFRSTTPITMLNIASQKLLYKIYPKNKLLKIYKRFPSIIFFIASIFLSFSLGKLMGGFYSGFIAAFFTAFDPNIIAHSSLVTVDSAFVFATLLFIYSSIKYAEKPRLVTIACLGLAIGFGACVKFTSLFFTPVIIFAYLIVYKKLKTKYLFLHPVILFLCAWCVIALFYRGVGLNVALKDIEFYSKPFQYIQNLLPNIPSFFPKDFLSGIDNCLATDRKYSYSIAFLDQHLSEGIWYFFPIVWLIKTPISIIILSLLGFIYTFKMKFVIRKTAWKICFISFVVFFIFFNFYFRTMVGIRYILMAISLFYILGATYLGTLLRNPKLKVLLFSLLLLAIFENFLFLGNHLAFTNLFVQPKKNVYNLISDSNINWGQSDLKIKQIAQSKKIKSTHLNPAHILKGENIIDLNHLVGVWYNRPKFSWVRKNLIPEAHINHTHLLYTVSKEKFEKFIKAERTIKSGFFQTNCKISNNEEVKNNSELIFKPNNLPCIKVVKNSRLIISSPDKRRSIQIGFLKNYSCKEELIRNNQIAYYDLTPGTYSICMNKKEDAPGIKLKIVTGKLFY